MFRKLTRVIASIVGASSVPGESSALEGRGIGQRFIGRLRAIRNGGTHSDRRWRAIGLMAAASMGERIVITLCSLVQVPIALRYLGTEGFGLWMTLTSLTNFMNIADLGLGAGMQNRLSEAYGRDDLADARRWFASGTILLAIIGLCMLVVTLPFCFLIDWGKVFHIHGSQHYAAAGPALAILVTSFFLGFPLTGAQRLTSAFQVGWMSSIKNVAAGILTLAAIGLAVWWKLNFLAFMLVVVLPPIIGNVVLLIVFFRQSRWSLESLRLIDRNSAKLLLRQNWLFMLPTIGATILGVAPAVLISGILGASALTPYNLALKLLSLFALVQAMLLGPLWPAYAEAKARGDVGWISATYKKSLWMTFLFSVMPTLSFSIWGRWALHIWSRNPIGSFDPWLIFLLCVWTAISSYSQTVALLLNALHKIKGQASYGLASVCLALAIMPACINKWGIAGAPMSLVCIFGLVALPLVCWEGHFQLKALIKLSNLTSEAGEIKNT